MWRQEESDHVHCWWCQPTLLVDYWQSIGRILVNTWLIHNRYIGQQSVECRLSVGQLSIKCRFRISWYISRYVDQLNLGWVTADITWSTLDLCSTNTQPTLNPLTSVYRLSVDQVLVDVSIEGHLIYWSIVTVDNTYSKHDLQNPDNLIIPKGKGEGVEKRGGKQESGKIQWEVKAWEKIKTFCNIEETFETENAQRCRKHQGRDRN